MANVNYDQGVPQVSPDTRMPDDYQHLRADPDAFGAALAHGGERLGAGLSTAGQFYGQVAADDGANNYIDAVNKVLHGDPTKKVKAPDGSEVPDPGYMGLQGAAAMRAYPDVAKQLKELREQFRGQMPTPDASHRFDQITRPEYSRRLAMAGTKSDAEFKTYGRQVNDATLNQAVSRAFTNANNPEEYKHAVADIRHARANTALLMGAQPGDAVYEAALKQADRDALGALVKGVAVDDPVKAYDILKRNRDLAGPEYPTIEAALLPKKREAMADRAAATATAPRLLTGAKSPLEIAEGLIGAKAGEHKELLQTVFGRIAGQTVDPQKTPWCAALVNGVLGQAGLPGSNSLLARSFLKVGADASADPQKGDIVVLSRGAPNSGLGHVGFYVGPGDTPGTIKILGGNQGGKVSVAEYSSERVLGYRRVTGADVGKTPMIDAAAAAQPDGPMPSREEARSAILKDPNLDYHERGLAISRVDQRYTDQTAERNAVAAAIQNDEKSIVDSGKPVTTLTPERVAAAYGPQAAAQFVENRGIAQTYYETTKTWSAQSNDDIDASLEFMDPKTHAAGSENYGKYLEYYDRAKKRAEQIKTLRATDPATAVAEDATVKNAMRGASLAKPESYQPVIEARMLAQQNVGVLEDNRMPLARAEAKTLWEPIRLSSENDRQDVIGETLRQLDVMTGGDRERANTAFQQVLASGGADKETRKISANLWRKLTNGQPVTREEAQVFDAANRTAMAVNAGAMLGGPSPKQLIVDYYHAAQQDIPPDVAKQYKISPEDAKMKPSAPGESPRAGTTTELSPSTIERMNIQLRNNPSPETMALYDKYLKRPGAAAAVIANAPAPSEDGIRAQQIRERNAANKARVNEQLRAIGEGREPEAVTPVPTVSPPTVSAEQRARYAAAHGQEGRLVAAQTHGLAREAFDAETQRAAAKELDTQLAAVATERKTAERMKDGPTKTTRLDALKRKETWLKEQIAARDKGPN